jgi:hypothetical protein
MADVPGIRQPEALPLSNIPAFLPPILAFAQHCDGHRAPLRRFIAFAPC